MKTDPGEGGAEALSAAAAQEAPAITKAALEGSDPLAVEAVDLFLAIIGAEAGYMGLRALATGGVYLCGGITPKARSRQYFNLGGLDAARILMAGTCIVSVIPAAWQALSTGSVSGSEGVGT